MIRVFERSTRTELTSITLALLSFVLIGVFVIWERSEAIADRQASIVADEELARLLAEDRWPGKHTQLLLDMTKDLNRGRAIKGIDDVVFPTVEQVREEAAKRGDDIALKMYQFKSEQPQ